MYAWRCSLKYFYSSDFRRCCFRMSSTFTIWHHWSTWAEWSWIYLGNSAAASLTSTGADCGGRAGRWNYFPVMVRYVAGCIANLRRPLCPPPNSDWMVDTFAWILRWILRMILLSMNPSHFFIILNGNFLQISSGFEVILVLWFHLFWCDWNFLNFYG